MDRDGLRMLGLATPPLPHGPGTRCDRVPVPKKLANVGQRRYESSMGTQRLKKREPRHRADVAVVALSLAVAVSSHAATFHVTNTLDSGAGSLRWAISNANATAGAATILCTNIVGTIALASNLPPITGAASILGPGPSLLTVSGSNMFRVLEVTASGTVSMSGLTIADGYITNTDGAGVFNAGTLSLSNCAVLRNRNNPGRGAGIYSLGNLTVLSSLVVSNVGGKPGTIPAPKMASGEGFTWIVGLQLCRTASSRTTRSWLSILHITRS